MSDDTVQSPARRNDAHPNALEANYHVPAVFWKNLEEKEVQHEVETRISRAVREKRLKAENYG
jgi:hypothetical protein